MNRPLLLKWRPCVVAHQRCRWPEANRMTMEFKCRPLLRPRPQSMTGPPWVSFWPRNAQVPIWHCSTSLRFLGGACLDRWVFGQRRKPGPTASRRHDCCCSPKGCADRSGMGRDHGRQRGRGDSSQGRRIPAYPSLHRGFLCGEGAADVPAG
jgi:hypothetical protein